MQKRLAGAGEPFDQRFHGRTMIAAGCVDDGVRGPRFGNQQRAIVERADDWFNAEALQFSGVFRVADQAAHVVAGAHETRGNRTADKTAGTGDENVQDVLLVAGIAGSVEYPLE